MCAHLDEGLVFGWIVEYWTGRFRLERPQPEIAGLMDNRWIDLDRTVQKPRPIGIERR
jgi:hypothetical protein